ncbi:MAG: SAM-dependent chlorinase/fluorinase [Bacteroidales bacterium]|jgi:S-adenosylmethionine hydrolase|nr:SAM-dependent chlorinase/fluorinase [Bacteroidales bacterium]
MAVITLTTGWIDDYHIAALKGIIFSSLPSAQIVDLSHHTPPFNSGIAHAAYMIRHCYAYYPAGTVHLISVASELQMDNPFIAALYDGQYFVGTDNGIFSLIFTSDPEKIIRIEKYTNEQSPNYPAISVFAPAAIHLAAGGDISELGVHHRDYQRRCIMMATINESQITGTIIHINAFGNAVTNITREDFDRVSKGRSFEITLLSMRNKITRINTYYHETSEGELLALFNLSGLLEVAINKGRASELLGFALHANVIVKFH